MTGSAPARFRPSRAYAWTLEGFPRSAKRWRFRDTDDANRL